MLVNSYIGDVDIETRCVCVHFIIDYYSTTTLFFGSGFAPENQKHFFVLCGCPWKSVMCLFSWI